MRDYVGQNMAEAGACESPRVRLHSPGDERSRGCGCRAASCITSSWTRHQISMMRCAWLRDARTVAE
jgi:hypothetical protein